MSHLPPLITAKGDIDTDWVGLYQQQTGASFLDAHAELNRRILAMPEPSPVNRKGAVNPVWVKWYCVRRRINRSTSRKACEKRIAEKMRGPVLPLDHHSHGRLDW